MGRAGAAGARRGRGSGVPRGLPRAAAAAAAAGAGGAGGGGRRAEPVRVTDLGSEVLFEFGKEPAPVPEVAPDPAPRPLPPTPPTPPPPPPAAAAGLDPVAPARTGRVVVVGAGGRTGREVLSRLISAGRDVIGVVRSEAKATDLARALAVGAGGPGGSELGETEALQRLVVGDLVSGLDGVLAGAGALVVCSSATPKIKKRSIVKMVLKKASFGLLFGKSRPSFRFPPGGMPREVDYEGVLALVRAAKAAGVAHVVVVGSMGGTQPDNFLNQIGDGSILVWKRAAEIELVRSGLPYTIVHPGGLLDEPAGQRKLVVGVDDTLLDTKTRSVPRGDVAEVCVQCVGAPWALNKAFDLASKPPEEGRRAPPALDFPALVRAIGDYDWSLNVPVPLPEQ